MSPPFTGPDSDPIHLGEVAFDIPRLLYLYFAPENYSDWRSYRLKDVRNYVSYPANFNHNSKAQVDVKKKFEEVMTELNFEEIRHEDAIKALKVDQGPSALPPKTKMELEEMSKRLYGGDYILESILEVVEMRGKLIDLCNKNPRCCKHLSRFQHLVD
eukprot:m.8015 g.8015  ORF g.8015 m.8015 type:complete len:158 (+) comp20260_c0_seq1:367-840(+)